MIVQATLVVLTEEGEGEGLIASVCCAAVRFVIVALLFLLNLYLTFTLLFKVIIYNLIPTIFLVLSIKLI